MSGVFCTSLNLMSLVNFVSVHICFQRCKVDVGSLPDKQANRLELPLEKQSGSLLMVISVAPCSGVSVSDLCVSPLGDPNERKQIAQRYVSLDAFLFKEKLEEMGT